MPDKEYMAAWSASKGPCGVAGCDGLYRARGFCRRHYDRLMKYGDPLAEPAPRPKKVKEVKPPRVRKYPKVCAEHKTYQAGCPACQAEARIFNRAYRSDPAKRSERNARERNRDRSGEHLRRSEESKQRGRDAVKARANNIPAPNRWQPMTDEQVNLVLSDMPATAVAALIGRRPHSVHNARHKARTDPTWIPGGQSGPNGGGPKWTTAEDERLAAMAGMPNKQIAEALGRTYEAVKFRKALLRRRGLIPTGGQR